MSFGYLLLELMVIRDQAYRRVEHEYPQEHTYGQKIAVAVYIVAKQGIEVKIKKECAPEQDEHDKLDELEYLEIAISVCLHDRFLSDWLSNIQFYKICGFFASVKV